MANVKKIIVDWSATSLTVYTIIRREVDNYRLNDADGTFVSAPTDPYISLTEDSIIKGRYELSESRTVWNNGLYVVAVYKQTGGSPAPVSDTIIGTGEIYIVDDAEIKMDASVASRSSFNPASDAVILSATQSLYAPSKVGDVMNLTSDYDAAKAASSQTSVNAIPTTPLLASNYTAPDNSDIQTIKADIEHVTYGLNSLLTAINTRLATSGYTAPDNTDIDLIKTVTDKIGGLIENVSGNRFTIKALEEAPTGGGGDVILATDQPNYAPAKAGDAMDLISDLKDTGNIKAKIMAKDNIDFGVLEKLSLNAATPASIQGNVGGNVVGTVGKSAMTLASADVSGNLPAQIKSIDDINLPSKMKADVNAECDMANIDYGANKIVPDVAGTAAGLHGVTDGKIDIIDNIVDSILTESQSHPTLTEIEATTILAKEATLANATYGLNALKSLIAALQADLGNPSVDITTIYAQLLLIKGYADTLENSIADIPITPLLSTDSRIDNLDANVILMLEIIKNKKYLEKIGNVWYLKIRNSIDTADIVSKALKDNTGANITDIKAGVLAQELKSDV
jgi:hypothetical protein